MRKVWMTKSDYPAIETSGLTKYYGKILGVKNLDLTVKQGEIYGFLGPNGAGKTTTIRLILGLLRPSAGEGRMLGLDISANTVELHRRVGYLPGELRLYDNMVASNLIDFVAKSRPDNPPILLDELLEVLEFEGSKRIGELSKGNKQKLALILSAMFSPDILILDEPTSGLDPLIQQHLYGFLRQYQSQGKTVFFSSHNLHEVGEICDRVGIIRNGNLVSTEKLEEIREKRLRYLRFEFKRQVDKGIFEIPQVLNVDEEGDTLNLTVRGSLDRVMEAAAAYQIEDLDVENATLEDVFFEYYGDYGKKKRETER